MSPDHLLLGLIIAYFGWRVFSSILIRRRLPALLKDATQVVDVRNPGEFSGGHAPGSVNIPLAEIDARAGELDKNQQVIVCFLSGTRSAVAAHRLRRLGFARVLNSGSWRALN